MTPNYTCSYHLEKPKKYRYRFYSIFFTLSFLFILAAAGHQCYGFPIANDPGIFQVSLSASFDGTNYLVGFQENNGQTRQVSAQFVSQNGSLVGPKITLDLVGGPPRVAFDGTNYFLITEEDTSSPTYIYGQFVSKAGDKIGSPLYVTNGTAIARPAIIFDGTNYFVVWNDSQTLHGQFVSPAGDLVGSPITICSGSASSPDVPEVYNVVSGGTNILVAWADSRWGCGTAICARDIYGQFVGKSGSDTPGSLVGANFPINENDNWSDMWTVGLAYDGTNHNYLVAWNDMTPNSGNARLYAQLIDESGTPVGGMISIGTPTQNQYRPGPMLAFDGTNYLLTWIYDKNDKDHDNICDPTEGSCWDSYGQFINPLGQLLGSSFLVSGGGKNQISYPVFGGGQYLLVTNSFDQFGGTSGTVTGIFLYPQYANLTGAPRISVTPMSVNFGKLKLEGTSEMTVTIKNTGTLNLAINLIDIAGLNASEFSQTNDCTMIPVGASCTITSTFAPSSLPYGQKNGLITISSNDPKKPSLSVKLLGNAPPPKISISPKSVNFGSVQAGSTSSPKTVTIKNTGTSDLVISDISIAGTNASEFNQTNDCASVLSASGSCTVTITFLTMLTGNRSAVLTVSSNDPQRPTGNVALSGNGTTMTSGTGIWDAAKWDSSTWDQ